MEEVKSFSDTLEILKLDQNGKIEFLLGQYQFLESRTNPIIIREIGNIFLLKQNDSLQKIRKDIFHISLSEILLAWSRIDQNFPDWEKVGKIIAAHQELMEDEEIITSWIKKKGIKLFEKLRGRIEVECDDQEEEEDDEDEEEDVEEEEEDEGKDDYGYDDEEEDEDD